MSGYFTELQSAASLLPLALPMASMALALIATLRADASGLAALRLPHRN